MTRNLFRAGAKLAARLGMLDHAYRVLGAIRDLRQPRSIVENYQLRRRGAPDGLPLPPPHLMRLVSGRTIVAEFLSTGFGSAAAIRSLLASVGRPITTFADVLDFGCGCGRVLRHWQTVEGPRFRGCDYNLRLVEWADRNLPFDVALNELLPLLPYRADSFDFVYALSVFTHLSEAAASAWMAEMRRVLRPDGFLFATMHGEGCAGAMIGDERAQFDGGEAVVTNAESEGSNVCAAFYPRAYVARLAEGFDIVAHRTDPPLAVGLQDQYLLRAIG